MDPIRYVIVGVGAGVFKHHHDALALDTFKLVGASDIRPEVKARADELGVPFFTDHKQMLAATKPELTVVTTPHPFHASIAIDAMEAGSHVLVEKPIAVRVAEADAMIAASERTGKLLALNFQQRCRGDIKTLKRLVDEGMLGKIQHVDMTTAWPRTATYYRGGGWRATWRGEGGGVLMNQAPHNLDLLCHVFGMPKLVSAWTRTTLHDIETEDTVHAMCEWPGGTLGSIHITTAEAGRAERLEVIGTAGSVSVIDGKLTYRVLNPDFRETIKGSTYALPAVTATETEVTLEDGVGEHLDIYRNLYEALREGATLIADGKEGRTALDLANAMILSSHERREVSLPTDRAAYEALFRRLAGTVDA
ncbi:MAG TPA: Gfo/Idh/MocA family oxidoreductase [Devosiaceae bacterium]|jgi:predicted dehydrogenase